jgi:hypothetical protein
MKKQLGRFISEVYRIISANPMSTAGEIFAIYKINNPGTIRSRNEVAKRVSELVKWGLAEYVGTDVCKFSGKSANTIRAKKNVTDYSLSDKEPEKKPVVDCSHLDCNKCGRCFDEDDFDAAEECSWDNPSESFCRGCEDNGSCSNYTCDTDDCDCGCCGDAPATEHKPDVLDAEDRDILRQIRLELEGLEHNPLFNAVAHLVPGVSEKAKRLKKALRNF